MPRVNIPVTEVTRAGVGPSEVTGDSANNHEFIYDPRAILVARNAAGTATRTVTLVAAATVDGQPVTNRTVGVPINATRYIGPFPAEWYRQADGKVYINVDHADLSLIVLRVP